MAKEKDRYYADNFGGMSDNQMVGSPVGRLVFAHLKTPNTKFKDQVKFDATIVFDKATSKAGLNTLLKQCAALQEVAEKKGIKSTYEVPGVRDGDDAEKDQYQGYKGCYYITAKNKEQPLFVDGNKKKVDVSLLVPGVKVVVVVSPGIYKEGFNWKLHVVQFVEDDGVRFRSGPDPVSVLKALGETSDDEESEDDTEETTEASEAKIAPKKSGKKAGVEML